MEQSSDLGSTLSTGPDTCSELIHMVIEKLSPQTLMQWLNDPQHPCLIEFHASWCIYHLLTIRRLQNLSQQLGPEVRAGSIDSVGNEALFTQLGIKIIPTIGYFEGGQRQMWVGDTDLEVMLEDIAALKQTNGYDAT